MKNSVAFSRRQEKREIKLAATGKRNVRNGFVSVASLLPVAACYGVTIFLKIFIT